MAELSVVIPCYNELANLENGVLDEVEGYLSGVDFDWEVVIVDDESTDGSRVFVESFVADREGWSVHTIEHGGKPAAVWSGIQRAMGDIVLFTDMDQSTPIQEWDKLRPFYDEGYDVVIGSRGRVREGFNPVRRLGSEVFRGIRRSLVLAEFNDTQCGFKSCRREVALECFPKLQFFEKTVKPSGWKVTAYDVELLYLFQRCGHRVKEVEVRWWNRDVSQTKADVRGRWQYLYESQEMLREIVRVKWNAARGLYD